MLELLDSFFRFGAITCCVITVALVARETGRLVSARLAILCSASTGAFLLCTTPGIGAEMGPFILIFHLLSSISSVAVWLFCLSLFDDAFRLNWKHYLVGTVFYMLCLTQHVQYYLLTEGLSLLSPSDLTAITQKASMGGWLTGISLFVFKAGMTLHLLIKAWSDRHNDLVEKRLRFRFVFALTVAFILIAMIITESWLVRVDVGLVHLSRTLQNGAILLVLFYMLWHMISMDGDWIFGTGKISQTGLAMAGKEDRHDLIALEKLVQGGSLLEQGLTISNLAIAAAMPEHRLRRLINQHLGFRNFSDYLNHHRVEIAKEKLADLNGRHVPILTLAMDLGYGSLGPFNRAFKERLGMTPTEFRRKALADC